MEEQDDVRAIGCCGQQVISFCCWGTRGRGGGAQEEPRLLEAVDSQQRQHQKKCVEREMTKDLGLQWSDGKNVSAGF